MLELASLDWLFGRSLIVLWRIFVCEEVNDCLSCAKYICHRNFKSDGHCPLGSPMLMPIHLSVCLIRGESWQTELVQPKCYLHLKLICLMQWNYIFRFIITRPRQQNPLNTESVLKQEKRQNPWIRKVSRNRRNNEIPWIQMVLQCWRNWLLESVFYYLSS